MTVKILAKSEAASHKREDERHVRCVHHIALSRAYSHGIKYYLDLKLKYKFKYCNIVQQAKFELCLQLCLQRFYLLPSRNNLVPTRDRALYTASCQIS